jgi:hypothetical protein
MNFTSKILGINTLLLITLLLTACGPTVPPSPTLDTNMLFTQAAQTVVAGLTQNAPTLTPTLAATNTPLPSMTPLGGVLPTLPPLSTLPPLATSTVQGYSGADKAEYITQSPADYASVKTGQVFNITWRLQNVGTTTWTPSYVYRFYSAIAKLPTAANGYNLTTTVPPKGFVDLTVVATAPSSPGTYDTRWVLTNPNGDNFRSFDLTITVVQGSSGGGTVATATGVPNACELNTLDGAPWSVPSTGTKTLELEVAGGQIYVYFISGDSLTAVPMTISEAASGYSNTVTAGAAELSEFFGDAAKTTRTVKFENLGTVDIKITHIYYYSSNNRCP